MNRHLRELDAFTIAGTIETNIANYEIAIPLKKNAVPKAFFPENATRFTIGTDDKKTLESRYVEQHNSVGINFTQGTAQAEYYFRNRLQIDKGGYVHKDDFIRYGTDSFLLFRLDDNVYFLDFSPDVQSDQKLANTKPITKVLLETKSPQYAAKVAQREARRKGLPFYPGRLEAWEELPYLAYNLGQIVVIRRQKTSSGDDFQVTLETASV